MTDETIDKIKDLTKRVNKQTEELIRKQMENNRIKDERRKAEDKILANGGKVKIGEVGVDGGMLMICDPCYLDNISNDEIDKLIFGDDDEDTYDWKQYGQLNYSNGHAGLGVIFQSGFGDGMYDIIATFGRFDGWGFRIKKVEIILIEEGEE